MEDPLLEESLKRHLDLWINTEFSWTEDQNPGTGSEPEDQLKSGGGNAVATTAAATPTAGAETKEKEDEEMDLMDYYKSRMRLGKLDKNVLLDRDDLSGKDVVAGGGKVGGETDLIAVVVNNNDGQGQGQEKSVERPGPAAVVPDLASFLNQYSDLLSSTLPSLDSLTPASRAHVRPLPGGHKASREGDVDVQGGNGEKTEKKKNHKADEEKDQSDPVSNSASLSATTTTSSSSDKHPAPATRAQRNFFPPAPPINSPVIPRAVPHSTDTNAGNDDKLPGQEKEQNLMALLAAAFPQYASSFETPARDMNAFLLNHHGSARAPQDSAVAKTAEAANSHASTPFVYAPHHTAFAQHGHSGMDYQHQQHQQLSGEIDRVFGTVDLGEGLYHPHHQGQHLASRRSSSATGGSITDASLNSFELGSQRGGQHQNLVQQQLATMSHSPPQGKKRKLSDESSHFDLNGNGNGSANVHGRAFEPRFTQASLASLTQQALGHHGYGQEPAVQQQQQARKRIFDSMEPDHLDGGVLPDGVTPEEE